MLKNKVVLLILLISGLSFTLVALGSDNQTGKGQIGVTFSSLGNVDFLSFAKSVGGPGYRGDGVKAFGLVYVYKINRTLDFETGLEYSDYKIIIEPNLPLIYHGTASLTRFSLINIPASLQVNFLKFFFLNGGAFFDINGLNSGAKENQSGLGASLGIGFKYNFKHGYSLFVNPFTKVHSLIPVTAISGQGRLIESGIRFGFLVQLNK